jgi:hypothetical protein
MVNASGTVHVTLDLQHGFQNIPEPLVLRCRTSGGDLTIELVEQVLDEDGKRAIETAVEVKCGLPARGIVLPQANGKVEKLRTQGSELRWRARTAP